MKISAAIDCLFPAHTMKEKLDYCKSANISAIELWHCPPNVTDLATMLHERDMTCIAICTSNFELTKEDNSKFLIELRKTCIAAKMLDCNMIITQSGRSRHQSSIDALNIIGNLQEAERILEEFDLTLLIEPLSRKHHPDTYLRDIGTTVAILDEVNSSHVKILFDIYHQYLTEGNILSNLFRFKNYIGHIHSAGTENRTELDVGELNYSYIFEKLSKFYDGYVGLEYYQTDCNSLQRMMTNYGKFFNGGVVK